MNISSLPSLLNPQAQSFSGDTLASPPRALPAAIESSATSSSEDLRQTALAIVNRTLTAAYEKISGRSQVAAAEYATFEPLSAEKVANNILGFIERRLQMDVADGASQEALAARLEAGLSGFKKGFAEASEKLESLSLLSPSIKSDLDTTFTRVTQGIDALRAAFIESSSAPRQEITSNEKLPSTEKAKKAQAALAVPDFLPANNKPSVGYANYAYASARELSFQLTTKEGDRLTINATSSEGYAVEAGRATEGSRIEGFYDASYSASNSLSWQVEGDLNDDELVAINDLLSKVNHLAEQFFEGDLDQAFEQALTMGYDASQIGSFALNASQVQIQFATQAYKTFEPQSELATGKSAQSLTDQLLPLGNFIKDLLDALDRSDVFSDSELLLTDMGKNITGFEAKEQGTRFSQFLTSMFSLELHSSTSI